MKRYAIITTTSERDNVAAYLPANYSVLYSEPSREDFARPDWNSVVIGGEDNAGWGLDSYVLPRLASGMMHGKEIDLSHDIMKRVPDKPEQTNLLWENNEIQFARLLCEIVATQDDLRDDLLMESMDLEFNELNELFERANDVWEKAKRNA